MPQVDVVGDGIQAAQGRDGRGDELGDRFTGIPAVACTLIEDARPVRHHAPRLTERAVSRELRGQATGIAAGTYRKGAGKGDVRQERGEAVLE